MYTYEERCVMNLGDCYTLLYGCIGRQLLDDHGETGEKALRDATRRFGIDRALATREKHLAWGAKINMQNLFTLSHDLPGDPRFRRELQELNPQERVSHTLVCPMADAWKAQGQREVGRIYCEEFHPACYSAYAYDYTYVNLAKTLTQEGDEYCAFNVVLRPENLPEELRPQCFEEYDPAWIPPEIEPENANGKRGFGILSIKLYFHLLQAALDHLGEEGACSVERGLQNFSGVAAEILKTSASKDSRSVDAAFVSDNVPIEMELTEPLWERYGERQAKERMEIHFCKNLLRKLNPEA
ncbi:MAG: L-2-amino-thiazoline-4-carboxylic acid hydrolase [Synergistaceae bacterium]|jgi:hypothetical protein|nr:L-2-amino-thiazoline-4-carboxylic acid hydrolase [Synergistaceae bacterium]